MMCLHVLLSVCFFWLIFIPEGHAYLDPGTGAMLLQMLAAGFFAVLVFGKRAWLFVSGIFAGKRTSGAENPENGNDE